MASRKAKGKRVLVAHASTSKKPAQKATASKEGKENDKPPSINVMPDDGASPLTAGAVATTSAKAPPAPKRRKATSSKKGSKGKAKQKTIAHTQPPDGAGDFDILPQDIQGRIFSLCSLSALYSAVLVCKEWHKLAEEYGDWDQMKDLKRLQDLKDMETCAQQDLVGALLLKPEQVKEMPFKRRSLGWGQYKHVFETKQAVKGLLEKHGGIRGLLERCVVCRASCVHSDAIDHFVLCFR